MGRQEIVELIIEKYGVDPRHKDPHGVTPYGKAMLYNRYELAQYIKTKEE